ncbi:hypothetical protein V2I01_28385 [Micromonospora sp. BRA006-A]|nr:hypothetical protein [Micromonospora sp. BRA006-A]
MGRYAAGRPAHLGPRGPRRRGRGALLPGPDGPAPRRRPGGLLQRRVRRADRRPAPGGAGPAGGRGVRRGVARPGRRRGAGRVYRHGEPFLQREAVLPADRQGPTEPAVFTRGPARSATRPAASSACSPSRRRPPS